MLNKIHKRTARMQEKMNELINRIPRHSYSGFWPFTNLMFSLVLSSLALTVVMTIAASIELIKELFAVLLVPVLFLGIYVYGLYLLAWFHWKSLMKGS